MLPMAECPLPVSTQTVADTLLLLWSRVQFVDVLFFVEMFL
jgi:hypothetical protein